MSVEPPKILSYDDPDLDWDQSEFYRYKGEPFSGLMESHMNGRLVERVAVRDGLAHGYYVYWHPNGQIIELGWNGATAVDGIRIQWDADGTITSVEKRWSGQLVQRLDDPNGQRRVVDVMSPADQQAFLDDPRKFTRYARMEPVDTLFDEALARHRDGTLFDGTA
jgi:hypothetical protein